MRHVRLYKKRGVPGIDRVEDDDNGKITKLDKGKFDGKKSLKEIEKLLKNKKVKLGIEE